MNIILWYVFILLYHLFLPLFDVVLSSASCSNTILTQNPNWNSTLEYDPPKLVWTQDSSAWDILIYTPIRVWYTLVWSTAFEHTIESSAGVTMMRLLEQLTYLPKSQQGCSCIMRTLVYIFDFDQEWWILDEVGCEIDGMLIVVVMVESWK